MKIKQLIAGALSVVMVGSMTTVVAFADEVEQPAKTYNYVAFGDSIAAGFGLSSNGGDVSQLAADPALILTEDLFANPVMEAYPAVFGTYLAELGEEKGYTTSATNLSSTAYRAQDISMTLRTPQSKGEIATWILETFGNPGSSDRLLKYHDFYTTYLTDADMVSIQLGGNDIIMAMLYPMMNGGNPVVTSVALAGVLTLFGCDKTIAIGGALQYFMQNKDSVKLEHFVEAAKVFASVKDDIDGFVENAAANVAEVVKASREVNKNTEIALVGMFNPFGNSLILDGELHDLCYVMKAVFAKAVCEVFDIEITVEPIEENETEAEIEEGAEEMENVTAELDVYAATIQRIRELEKQRLKSLFTAVVEEMSYPLQYLLVGRTVNPSILSLNEKLQAIADETIDCTYVDVYDISNENNLDPHPEAAGHKEIADRLWATMKPVLEDALDGKRTIGDVNLDGVVNVEDATLLQCYLAEFTNDEGQALLDLEDGNTFRRCDVNRDGMIDVRDLTAVLRVIAEFVDVA